MTIHHRLPRISRHVIARELGDEVVVYDARGQMAHTFIGVTASVWRGCDGKTTYDEMVRQLAVSLPAADHTTVAAAVRQLDDLGLVDTGPSRRTLIAGAAIAGVALPAVSSIAGPLAAAHASTTGGGGGGGGGSTQSVTVFSGFAAPAPNGTPDPKVKVSSDGGATFQSALVTSNGAYDVIPGTQYVDDGTQDEETFILTATFVLPAGYSSPSLSGQFETDNHGDVFLNGSGSLAHTDSFGGPTPFSTSNASLFTSGTNTLRFTVLNDGGPWGLDFTATVTYTA